MMALRVHTRGGQCTRWHDRLPQVGEHWEPFPIRIQRPALQAAGHEVLPLQTAGFTTSSHRLRIQTNKTYGLHAERLQSS